MACLPGPIELPRNFLSAFDRDTLLDMFDSNGVGAYHDIIYTDALQRTIASDGEDEDVWETFEDSFNEFLDFSWIRNWDGVKYDIVPDGCSG